MKEDGVKATDFTWQRQRREGEREGKREAKGKGLESEVKRAPQ